MHSAYGTVTLYESLWWPVGTQLDEHLSFETYKCKGLPATGRGGPRGSG